MDAQCNREDPISRLRGLWNLAVCTVAKRASSLRQEKLTASFIVPLDPRTGTPPFMLVGSTNRLPGVFHNFVRHLPGHIWSRKLAGWEFCGGAK